MPNSTARQDWLSLPQIFFCRSNAHSAASSKLVPKAFGTQTVEDVAASLAKNENEKSLMSLKPILPVPFLAAVLFYFSIPVFKSIIKL